jgi:hypothetical protein
MIARTDTDGEISFPAGRNRLLNPVDSRKFRSRQGRIRERCCGRGAWRGRRYDARLEGLGYKPQLNRVLGFFENFAVGFTYLSPMVGIYTLFLVGVAAGGPAYVWLTLIPLIGMFFVALVFGEFRADAAQCRRCRRA